MNRAGRLPVAAALGVLVVVAAILIARQEAVAPLADRSASTTPTASARQTSSDEATPSRTPDPSASPSAEPTTGIEVRANALGRLTGNWIFAGKRAQGRQVNTAENQIWAVPLDGGAPRLAFAYDVGTVGIGLFDNTPYLRRQFSPDGTRVVIAGLVVVDLVTGQTKPLGVSGKFPAWSKDGSRIAFFFQLPVTNVVPPEYAIGVIPAAGGPVKQLALVGYQVGSVEWSPDGSMLMVAQPDVMTIVDADNGGVLRRIVESAAYGPSFAQWRAGTPQIAVATGGCDRTTTKLVGFDDATAPRRTLLDTRERCPALSIRDPRWNPAAVSELLYVATRANVGAMPHEYRVHLFDIGSGRDTTLPLSAYEATWTWDGAEIAYVANAGSDSYGDSVRLWRRDGSGERVLLRAAGTESFFSVASLRY